MKWVVGLGLVVLVHAGVSVLECTPMGSSVINVLVREFQTAVSVSSRYLPVDIYVETLLGFLLFCLGVFLSCGELKSIYACKEYAR